MCGSRASYPVVWLARHSLPRPQLAESPRRFFDWLRLQSSEPGTPVVALCAGAQVCAVCRRTRCRASPLKPPFWAVAGRMRDRLRCARCGADVRRSAFRHAGHHRAKRAPATNDKPEPLTLNGKRAQRRGGRSERRRSRQWRASRSLMFALEDKASEAWHYTARPNDSGFVDYSTTTLAKSAIPAAP